MKLKQGKTRRTLLDIVEILEEAILETHDLPKSAPKTRILSILTTAQYRVDNELDAKDWADA